MAKNKEKKEKAEVSSPLTAHARWMELLLGGDNRTARAEASKALADPAASESDKAAAREVLQRTRVEPVTLGVGVVLLSVLAIILALLFL